MGFRPKLERNVFGRNGGSQNRFLASGFSAEPWLAFLPALVAGFPGEYGSGKDGAFGFLKALGSEFRLDLDGNILPGTGR
jgi:hypothetical protein